MDQQEAAQRGRRADAGLGASRWPDPSRAVAAGLMLAVGTTHIGVLGWVAAHGGAPARVGASATAPHRWMLARALSAAAGEVPPRKPPPVAEAAAPLPAAPIKPPTPPAAPRPTTVDGDVAAASPVDPAAVPATRFYGYDEVDAPAHPTGDWNIDVQAFDALALSRIVVTLYIDDGGSVVRCTVDEPARLTAAERDALAERIARTALEPARLRGAAVASKRRIELTSAESG